MFYFLKKSQLDSKYFTMQKIIILMYILDSLSYIYHLMVYQAEMSLKHFINYWFCRQKTGL